MRYSRLLATVISVCTLLAGCGDSNSSKNNNPYESNSNNQSSVKIDTVTTTTTTTTAVTNINDKEYNDLIYSDDKISIFLYGINFNEGSSLKISFLVEKNYSDALEISIDDIIINGFDILCVEDFKLYDNVQTVKNIYIDDYNLEDARIKQIDSIKISFRITNEIYIGYGLGYKATKNKKFRDTTDLIELPL